MSELPNELLAQLPEPDKYGLRFVMDCAEIKLPNGLSCWVKSFPDAQQDPSDGDQLVSNSWIALPCDPKDKDHLAKVLRFGDSLRLFDEALNANWGNPSSDGNSWRYRRMTHAGDTWVESLLNAEKAALGAVATLWSRIAKRKAALESPGYHFYLARSSGLARE